MINFEGIDSNLEPIDTKDIISKGITLMVHSATDLVFEHTFLEYCNKLQKDYNIDRVLVVNSAGSNLFHPHIQTYWPNFITVGDPELQHIIKLKKLWDLPRTPEELVKVLRYQILLKDGDVINSWRQPVTDHWSSFMKNKKAMMQFILEWKVYGAKFIREQEKGSGKNIWERVANWKSTPNTEGIHLGIIKFLYYYNLLPNKQLEETLKSIK